MHSLEQKSVYVLGAGASGLAAARLARREGAAVTLVDGGDSPRLQALADDARRDGVAVVLGWQPPAAPVACDLCVCSPGIPLGSPMSDYFAGLGCPVVSELEFGGSHCPWPKLAVTGTNGKTTVVEMTSHCLAAVGKRVLAGGNIGLPLAQVALDNPALDVLVVEVSSFQMERTENFESIGAALLNITPDHLNRHGSLECYAALKLRLLQQVEPAGACIVRRSLLDNAQVAKALQGKRVVTFSSDSQDADYVVHGNALCRRHGDGSFEELLSVAELPFGGSHNYENCLAAIALGETFGVEPAAMAAPLKTFAIGHHRMEIVREDNGVRYVNDSKATNLDALVQSVRRFDNGRCDIALIAGGLAKGCDLAEALPELRGRVKAAFIIGTGRDDLAAKWGKDFPCAVCDSFQDAVEGAADCVRQQGGTVLLAPGCASMDMFTDYVERGKRFVEIVNDIQ